MYKVYGRECSLRMKLLTISLLFLSLSGCQKASEQEIDIFFERLSVLVIKSNIIDINIQNAQTTRTVHGGAYVPKEAKDCLNGTCQIVPLSCKGIGCPPKDMTPLAPILKFEPKHPDANENGYVAYPNLNIHEEMSKLIRVQRAKEYLFDSAPVEKSFFYSKDIQKYLEKYPALDVDYNFERILRE